jgi:hypothetical protein
MKPSLKNTRYVLSSQSLLTMSVVLIVVWIYIFLAPAPVNVSEVSLPWFATATPAASVTPTKTATPTVIPSPTATLSPTPTVTPTPTPESLDTVANRLAEAIRSGETVCAKFAWEKSNFKIVEGSAVIPVELNMDGEIRCYYYLVFSSKEEGSAGWLGWLVYGDKDKGIVSVPLTYTAGFAKFATSRSGWTTPTPIP